MIKRTIRKFFANIDYKVLFFAILGSALVAFGSTIHDHSGAADGGILGVARLVAYYSGGKVQFSTVIILLNAFFYLVAWRLMNAKFISTMAFGTISFYIFTNFFSSHLELEITNVLLATIVGATFIEIGTGLMLRYGSAPTGEHVLTTSISKRGAIDFGWISFIKDFLIIIMCFPIVDGINAIIYRGYCIIIRVHGSVLFILKLNFFRHVQVAACSVFKATVYAADSGCAKPGLRGDFRIYNTV